MYLGLAVLLHRAPQKLPLAGRLQNCLAIHQPQLVSHVVFPAAAGKAIQWQPQERQTPTARSWLATKLGNNSSVGLLAEVLVGKPEKPSRQLVLA